MDKDWQVAKNYVDVGASATDDNRADFQAMIAEACSPANPFDVVIVHSQSRFARNTLDLLHYTNKLEKAGVQFVSITQDLGQGEQAGVLRTILGAMDEYQSKETSKHTRRSMREKAHVKSIGIPDGAASAMRFSKTRYHPPNLILAQLMKKRTARRSTLASINVLWNVFKR